MTTKQIDILIEDGTELSSTLVKFDFVYKVGKFPITKKQFNETYDKYKDRFNDVRDHGGSLKQTFRINKNK